MTFNTHSKSATNRNWAIKLLSNAYIYCTTQQQVVYDEWDEAALELLTCHEYMLGGRLAAYIISRRYKPLLLSSLFGPIRSTRLL